jgi:glutamyl-tRNA reductase
MSLINVFGLDYTSADFALREQFAITKEKMPQILQSLRQRNIITEAVIVSTCNRTEIYSTVKQIEFLINAVCELQSICPRTTKKYIYTYTDQQCIVHLCKVLAGLESMAFGETEIVAQIKESVTYAQQQQCMGSTLNFIFQLGFKIAKQIRTITQINSVSVSIGRVLLNLLAVNFSDLQAQKILFIGAGDMLKHIAPYFSKLVTQQKTICNRSLHSASKIANEINADILPLDKLASVVNQYSIIIACSSGNVVLTPEIIHNIQNKVLIIDLSVPLITDLKLRQHNNVTVLTIDDISSILDIGKDNRKQLALLATDSLNQAIKEYDVWVKKRELTPIICALRDHVDAVRQELLEVGLSQLKNGKNAEWILENMSMQLANRLIHAPTTNLYNTDKNLHIELSDLLTKLYNL